jgi:hypothetical protein
MNFLNGLFETKKISTPAYFNWEGYCAFGMIPKNTLLLIKF